MTSFAIPEAALFELNTAAEAAALGLKAAQEAHGLEGLWFPLKDGWQWFGGLTNFKQDMQDAGYEGNVFEDLSLIKAFANRLRHLDLFITPRIYFAGKIRSTVWVRRSLYLDHDDQRYKIASCRGPKSQYDQQAMWQYNKGDE